MVESECAPLPYGFKDGTHLSSDTRYVSLPRILFRVLTQMFPQLSGSSVGVERRLNMGRDVISLRRASLKAETIRNLMTGRSALALERSLVMKE
jgi:hypothetical protein